MSHTIRINTIVMRPYQGGNFPVRLIQGWLRKNIIPTDDNYELYFGS